MDHQIARFAVEYCAPGQRAGRILRSTDDPNAATVAFHNALWHLCQQGHEGEVVLRSHGVTEEILLRQSLSGLAPAARSTKARRAAPLR